MSVLVKFTCTDCDRDVFVAADQVQLDFAADDPDAVIATETCGLGHVREQRFTLSEKAHVIRALLNVGVRTPEADDIQASIDAHGDAVTWLDSDAFDTDRADLRLTGGAA